MFEESLVESQSRVVTGTERLSALSSVTLQCAVVALLLAVPLLHPESLPAFNDAPKLVLPPPRPPSPPVHVQPAAASASSGGLVISVAPVAAVTRIFPGIRQPIDEPEPFIAMAINMASSPTALLAATSGPVRVVSGGPAKAAPPMRVSAGVSQGMLLAPIRPIYPRIALAAGIQGTVVLEAVISKTGSIESLHVVSGPEMLRRAALDAVQAARYQPYRLNGETTEVQTIITVAFRLGS
jgi:periplasmic protein TonB